VIQAEFGNFDILAFSETWLSPNISNNNIKLDNFHTPERKDGPNDNHGGVLLNVKNNISYKRRHDIELLGTENIWIELTLKCNNNMLVGLFYRPPNTNAAIDQSIVNSIDLA